MPGAFRLRTASFRQTSCGPLTVSARQIAEDSIDLTCQGMPSEADPNETVTITYAAQNLSGTFPVSFAPAVLLDGQEVTRGGTISLSAGELRSGLTVSFTAPGSNVGDVTVRAAEAVFIGDQPVGARAPVRADGGVSMRDCGCSHRPAASATRPLEAFARVGR